MERKEFNSLNEAITEAVNKATRDRRVARAKGAADVDLEGKAPFKVATIDAIKTRAKKQFGSGFGGDDLKARLMQRHYDAGAKTRKTTLRLRSHVEYDEADSMVLEYFNNYFGDDLNEDTSDEDIMNAVYDLVDLTEAVCDAVGLDEN